MAKIQNTNYPNCIATRPYPLLVEIKKCTVALEDSLAISSKAKRGTNIQYSNHVLRYLPN